MIESKFELLIIIITSIFIIIGLLMVLESKKSLGKRSARHAFKLAVRNSQVTPELERAMLNSQTVLLVNRKRSFGYSLFDCRLVEPINSQQINSFLISGSGHEAYFYKCKPSVLTSDLLAVSGDKVYFTFEDTKYDVYALNDNQSAVSNLLNLLN